MNNTDLKSYFNDPERAHSLLRELIEPLIGSFDERGEPFAPDELHRVFLNAIRQSPHPDKTLLNIHRMAEAAFGISFSRDLVRYPVLMELAVKIASHSQFLSDIVVRDPELFRWLTASEVLSVTNSKDHFLEELKKQTGLFTKRETQFNAIRRLYRREILRIGVRDILGDAPFEVIVGEISALADAIAEMVLELITGDFTAKYNARPDTKFTIIGLGKLGGNELNYSSDIDIMFVMEDDVTFTTAPGRKMHAMDFYSSVADKWIAVMTEHSREGSLYRVDARLRPDGKAGPLVRSATGYRTYYESRGELWERQMLIKGRPIAGDIEFGRRFIESLQPFIYPATLFQSPRETITRMKARIEKRSGDPNNIKLCRGGIRDIEFIVQALQLLNGGKDTSIRSGTTLRALELLFSGNYITAEEHTVLRGAYIFFRKLEHYVQLEENIQTHSLPVAADERKSFARKAGFESAGEFEKILSGYLEGVRRIFDSVFDTGKGTSIVEQFFQEDTAGDLTDLTAYGFTNTKRARDLLQQLAHGVTEIGVGEHDTRTKEIFRNVAPHILQDLSSSINPDRALINLLSIAQAYPHPHSFYIALQNEGVRKALINVCGYSNKLAMQLTKYQEDLELLMNNAHEVLGSNDMFDSDVLRFSDRFLYLAVHTRFINARCGLDEVHRFVSSIAVRRIRNVLQDIYREHNLRRPPLAVLALGKLSGKELGPGADLDLILLYKAEDDFGAVDAERIAKELIRLSAIADDASIPFEVDMRLRPEGRSGPLAVDVDVYREYLEKRASLWERQSLVRAKVIDGPDELASEISSIIEHHTFEKPLKDDWKDEILAMRYRTENRSKMNRYDFVDIKTGPGGIMDIEFFVQTIQLHAGKMNSSLRTTSTREALKKIKDAKIVGSKTIAFLSDAYEQYRYVEYFNRIYADDRSNLIPAEAEEQEKLMKLLQIKDEAIDYFKSTAREVRKVFLDLMKSRISGQK